LLYVLLGLGVASCGAAALFVVAVARAFDTDRDLSDFATPAEARTFVSEHLPSSLPTDAVVEKLAYERWTDWNLDARVRLTSAASAERYLEQVKRDRKLDDAYCFGEEPPDGARYFLSGVFACGVVRRPAPAIIEVHCNTR
jgi:hypothetical protein